VKRLLILSFGIVFLFSTCAFSGFFNSVKGSGTPATEERKLPEFNSVEVSGSWDVEIQCGKEQKVVITVDDNLMPLVITEVKDGTLKIYTDKNIRPKVDNEIKIFVKELKSLSTAGSVDVKASDISTENFKYEGAGSSDIELSGKVVNFNIEVAGSADIEAKDLHAENVNIEIAGSADAEVYASKKLNVEAAGSADVTYYGDPESVSQDVAGSASVVKG